MPPQIDGPQPGSDCGGPSRGPKSADRPTLIALPHHHRVRCPHQGRNGKNATARRWAPTRSKVPATGSAGPRRPSRVPADIRDAWRAGRAARQARRALAWDKRVCKPRDRQALSIQPQAPAGDLPKEALTAAVRGLKEKARRRPEGDRHQGGLRIGARGPHGGGARDDRRLRGSHRIEQTPGPRGMAALSARAAGRPVHPLRHPGNTAWQPP